MSCNYKQSIDFAEVSIHSPTQLLLYLLPIVNTKQLLLIVFSRRKFTKTFMSLKSEQTDAAAMQVFFTPRDATALLYSLSDDNAKSNRLI